MGRKFEILEGYPKPVTVIFYEQKLIKETAFFLVIFVIGDSRHSHVCTCLYSCIMLLKAFENLAHSEK